jgi:hypothetical protein
MSEEKIKYGRLSRRVVYPTNVEETHRYFFKDLFNSVSNVILIDNLPEKADNNYVISNLILTGHIAAIRHEKEIYMVDARLGGERDVNFYPKRVIGANPVIGTIDLERGVDGEVIYLTPFDKIPVFNEGFTEGGLFQLISITASLLADNICSLNCAQINGRVQAIVTAEDSQIAKSAEIVLKDLYAGKPYKVLTDELYKHIHVNPLASSVHAKQLIELIETQQYIRAQFWNSIGIDANYNMKRERLNEAEINSNFTALKVPVTTMLATLNEGFESANKCLGTKLHARLNPEYKVIKANNFVNSQKSEVNNNETSNQKTETSDNI